MSEGWIEGLPPRLSREAMQVETSTGHRAIALCPACSGIPVGVTRYRFISPIVKSAYIAGVARLRREDGSDANELRAMGERLRSYCCGFDMVIMPDRTLLCLHCLNPAPTATEIVKNQPQSK